MVIFRNRSHEQLLFFYFCCYTQKFLAILNHDTLTELTLSVKSTPSQSHALHMTVIPAARRLRQEDYKSEASIGYTETFCLKESWWEEQGIHRVT